MRATRARSSSLAISDSIKSTWFMATSSRISLRTSPETPRGNCPVTCRCSGDLGVVFCGRPGREEFGQAALGAPRIAFDERIEAGPDAAVGKRHDHRLAHLRVRLEPRRDAGGVVEEPRPAALAVANVQHVAGDPGGELLAGRQPGA